MTYTLPVMSKRCQGKHKNICTTLYDATLTRHSAFLTLTHLTIINYILQHSCASPATFKNILTRCRGEASWTHTRDVYESMNLHTVLLSDHISNSYNHPDYSHYSTQHIVTSSLYYFIHAPFNHSLTPSFKNKNSK